MGEVIDRLLRRSPAGDPHVVPFPAGAACGVGCADSAGYRCEYVDGSGAQCGWWCRNHTIFVGGQAWCRRHASVVKWLKPRQGRTGRPIYDLPIDDRSPNLVESIVDMLDGDVSRFLCGAFAMHSTSRILADDHVRPSSIRAADVEPSAGSEMSGPEGRQGAWERGWSVHSDVGNLARVVLRASATEPPVVHLYVNDKHVLRRVPDWIANRAQGADPELDRAAFAKAVLDSVEQSLGLTGVRRPA